MDKKEALIKRLEEIGDSLAQTGQAVALIGLGSVGTELDRLDDYSDLDFFAIVAPGRKQHFLADLGWLSRICPVAYAFANTEDGYKLLYSDGIFCEFAVFEAAELEGIPFAHGRVVWKLPHVPETIASPKPRAPREPRSVEWLLGELLTNLYVGLGRFCRGEKLTAQRFIQHYAVDRLLELAAFIETEAPAHRDPFANERRFEQRFPSTAALLPQFVPGYEGSVTAVRAILAFVSARFPVNTALAEAILALCNTAEAQAPQ